MKKERKNWRAIRRLGMVFILSHFLYSCITINRIQSPQSMASNVDPVCGMKVDTSTALKTDYAGRTYYFDSQECQKVFLRNPEKFAPGQMYHDNHHNMMGGWMGGVAIATMVVLMASMMLWRPWR